MGECITIPASQKAKPLAARPRDIPNMEGWAVRAGARKSPRRCQLSGSPLAALGWENNIVLEEKAGSLPEPIWPELGWPGPPGAPGQEVSEPLPAPTMECWGDWGILLAAPLPSRPLHRRSPPRPTRSLVQGLHPSAQVAECPLRQCVISNPPSVDVEHGLFYRQGN